MERQSDDKSDPEFRTHTIDGEDGELVVFSWKPGMSPVVSESELPPNLTAAERAVCALLVVGLSDAEIAELRGTTRSTITKQVDAIFRKLGVRSRRELIARHSTQRT